MRGTTRSRRGSSVIVLAVSAGLLTSCARLQIDVDVYKGPLANEEEVQIEQVAAMAIGAKPLLIELRDELEARDRFPGQKDAARRLREQEWLRDDYVPRPLSPLQPISSIDYPFFKNPHALRVNSLLSLYENQEASEVPEIVRAGLRAFEEYKAARDIVLPDPELDGELWARYGRAYEQGEPQDLFEELRNTAREEPRQGEEIPQREGDAEGRDEVKTDAETVQGIREHLWTAYAEFLDPATSKKDYRQQDQVLHSHLVILRESDRIRVLHRYLRPKAPEVAGVTIPGEPDLVQHLGANVVFEALSQRHVAESHARLLFADREGEHKEIADDFVARVVSIARAFGKARQSLYQVWRNAALFLASDEPVEASNRTVLSEAARSAVAGLTSAYVLDAALLNPNAPREPKEFLLKSGEPIEPLQNQLEGFREAVGDASEKDQQDQGAAKQELSNAYEDVYTALEGLLWKDPVRCSTALLAVDGAFRRSFALDNVRPEPPDRYRKYLAEAPIGALSLADLERLRRVRRKYGVVVGPGRVDAEESTAIVNELLESVMQELGRDFAQLQGLEGGRLLLGLEQLIEDYVDAAYQQAGQDDPGGVERERMLDALVRFAEKLRFLAGFQSLLYDSDDYESADQILTKNTDVLSAVASSILSQIDALKASVRFRRDEGRAGKLERVGHDSGCDCEQCQAAAKLARKAEPKNPREVMDAVIARLRHQLIRRVEDEGKSSDSAKRIQEALDVAYAERSGMVFVRPAVAFLRNSYVVRGADGEDEERSAGGRFVSREVGYVQALNGRIPDKEAQARARTLADIDQQFWQPVNTVKLFGPGKSEYVLVKDDIGNWYIKSYSASIEKIIETAKNLAMFAAAGSINPAALAQAQQLMSLRPDQPIPDSSREQVADVQVLDRMIEKERESDRAAALERYHELREGMATVEEAVVAAWHRNPEIGGSAEDRKKRVTWLRLALRAVPPFSLSEVGADEAPEKLNDGLEAALGWRRILVEAIVEPEIQNQASDVLDGEQVVGDTEALTQKKKELEATKDQLEKDLEKLVAELKEKENLLKIPEAERQKPAREKLEELQAERGKLEDQLTENRARVEELEANVKGLEEEKAKADAQVESFRQERDDKQAELEAAPDEEKEDLEKELTKLQTQLREAETKAAEASNLLSEEQSALADSKTEVERTTASLAEKRAAIEEQQNVLRKLSGEAIRNDIQNLEKQIDEGKAERESIERLLIIVEVHLGTEDLDTGVLEAARATAAKVTGDLIERIRSQRLATIREHTRQLNLFLEASSPETQ